MEGTHNKFALVTHTFGLQLQLIKLDHIKGNGLKNCGARGWKGSQEMNNISQDLKRGLNANYYHLITLCMHKKQ